MSLVIFFSLIISDETSSQERKIELTAQGILARVDRIMEYPGGIIRGKIKHIRPDGKSFSINLTAFIAEDNYLFTFGDSDRGDRIKVLYNLGGEDIWVYNIHAIKLYHKMGIDKYDPLLATNYTYLDISNSDFQSNYTASIVGEAIVKSKDSYKLILKPIYRGGMYGIITLYVSKDDFIPLRIDYHDRDNAIFKFMTIAKVRKRGKRIVPVRYDMMDIRSGTVTIMSFFDFEENVKFDANIFRSEKLGE